MMSSLDIPKGYQNNSMFWYSSCKFDIYRCVLIGVDGNIGIMGFD